MGWSHRQLAGVAGSVRQGRAGNAVPADVLALDCRDTLVRTNGPKVAVIGVEGLVTVATPEAVLVMRPEEAQRVREAARWFEDHAKPQRMF